VESKFQIFLASPFSLHVAREQIERNLGFRNALPNLGVEDHVYKPGGHDQINIIIPCTEFNTLMDRDSVGRAIRNFNLRLMRKGPCNFGRYHCLDLADDVIEE
jgi:hypothetical protein